MIQLLRVNKVYLIVFFILLLDLIFAPKGGDSSRFIPLLFKVVIILLGLFQLIYSKGIRSFGRFVSVLMAIVFFLAISIIFVRDNYLLLRINNFIKLLFWLSFAFIAFNSKNNILNDTSLLALILLVALNIIRDSLTTNLLLGSGVVVSNYGYNAVRIFPLIYFIRKKKIRLIFMLIAVICTLISLKRGAILIMFVLTFIYLKNHVLTTRWMRLIFISILCLSMLNVVNSDWFQFFIEARFSDFDNRSSVGSGRGLMFELILVEWMSSFKTFFFGHGYLGTWNFFADRTSHRMSAHSDLFEFVYDLGLLGISMWFLLMRYLKLDLNENYVSRDLKTSFYIIFLFTAIYTNNIFHPYFFLLIYAISLSRCRSTNHKPTVLST